MSRLINDPDTFVDETLAGILAAHGDVLRATEDPRALVRTACPIDAKLGIVTGGGSGHLPLFLGYVGDGLTDGVAVGNVFSSPSAETILQATRAVDAGRGVLYLFGNYGGDVMNFDLAGELAAEEGITTARVLGTDDVASAPKDRREDRRGIAGIFFLYKVAGAAARAGASLQETTELARHAGTRVGTMSVGLAPCILPAAGEPTFELADDEMEIGVGIHGEPGVSKGPLEPADAVARRLIEAVVEDLGIAREEDVAVLVNGLGATPPEELYILYRHVHALLNESGIRVRRTYVGEFATSLEMAGASVSVMALDHELRPLLEEPAHSPFFAQP